MREAAGCLVLIAGLALTGCCFSSCLTGPPPKVPAPDQPQAVAQAEPEPPAPPPEPEPAPAPAPAAPITKPAIAPAAPIPAPVEIKPLPVPVEAAKEDPPPSATKLLAALKEPGVDAYGFFVAKFGAPSSTKKYKLAKAGASRYSLVYDRPDVMIVMADAPPPKGKAGDFWRPLGYYEVSTKREIEGLDAMQRILGAQRAEVIRRENALRQRKEAEVRRKAEQEAAERAEKLRAQREAEERKPSGVTYKSYQRIKTGDSYERVREIIGRGGTEVSSNSIAGITTVLMEWKSGLAVLHVYFQNGSVTMKSQFGLD